jgi:thiol-disulfide isomerase/thioredoxin
MASYAPVHMPGFDGATAWLNSDPLTPAELRGRVVLVDFWTLTCINWLRTEPYVRAWSQAYRDDGLVVIGVHTPEFAVEHDVAEVRRATAERGIHYPVAVDNDYAIWTAFANQFWPALYFVDRDGLIRDEHFGEGRYKRSERTIQELLGIQRDPVVVEPAGVEAQADCDSIKTPETYLGLARAPGFTFPDGAALDRSQVYQISEQPRLNGWAIEGQWTVRSESLDLDRAGGRIAFRFHARDAHLVMGSSDPNVPVPMRVTLDGAPPGEAHGVDVDPEGGGIVSHPRLYQLIRQPGPVRDRTVTIEFRAPGVYALVFTFG